MISSMPLCNVGWNRNSGSLKLLDEPILLLARK